MVGWSTMTHITDLRRDLEAETSEWLFKSPLAGGGGILWRPHLPAAQATCSEQAALTAVAANRTSDLRRVLITAYDHQDRPF